MSKGAGTEAMSRVHDALKEMFARGELVAGSIPATDWELKSP
jgi:hypothetical protein